MTPFAAYRDQNIQYWTKRAPSYGDVNREELATAQHDVWRQHCCAASKQRFKTAILRRSASSTWAPAPAFLPFCLPKRAFRSPPSITPKRC